MQKKRMNTLGMGTVILLFIVSLLTMNGSALSLDNGDPYRILDTNLNYGFNNGTLFMYNTTTYNLISITNGTEIESENETDYDTYLDQVSYKKFDNDTTDLNISTFKNITNTPLLSIDITEWSLNHKQINNVNTSLISIFSASNQAYFPKDVFVSDVLKNNDAIFEIFTNLMFGEDLEDSPFGILSIVENESLSDNLTVTRKLNKTVVSLKNNLQGKSNTSLDIAIEMNGFEGMNGITMELYMEVIFDMDMNCYHTLNNLNFSIALNFRLINTTNPTQQMAMNLIMTQENDLIASTLPPCNETQWILDNWVWILLLSLGVFGLIIGLSVDKFVTKEVCNQLITQDGTERVLTESEFKQLPNACQKISKYKPISK